MMCNSQEFQFTLEACAGGHMSQELTSKVIYRLPSCKTLKKEV